MEVRTNGSSIKDFAPHIFRNRETGLYTPEDEPQYKPQVSNGYVPYDFPTNGLVLYLPFYLLKESKFKSLDDYRHTCDVNDALWKPNGRLFDDTDDKIDVTIGSELTHGTADWTWSFWLKKASHLDDDHIFRKPTSSIRLKTTGTAGAMAIHFEGESVFNTNTALYDAGSFTFITIQRSGNDCIIRKNGASFQTVTNSLTTGNQTTADTALRLGNYNNVNGLAGTLGEFWVYTRLLNTAEDSHNYNVTKWRYQ